MFSISVILILVCAVLLVVVVLAQNPKGGGLSDQFGGSSSSQLIGVKRTGDLLEKITWGLLVAIFALSILSYNDGTIIAKKNAQNSGQVEEGAGIEGEETDKTEIDFSSTPAVQPGTGEAPVVPAD